MANGEETRTSLWKHSTRIDVAKNGEDSIFLVAMFDQRTKEDTRKRMGSLNLKGILALSCIFSDRLAGRLECRWLLEEGWVCLTSTLDDASVAMQQSTKK
ncbi:hypothetical protein Tco_0852196 [Tanacetum coccineum]